ncbi:MAG: exosortase/archaeosortase family protein, partial [Candidatus Bathyarchaeota archaeon]|nr:exosortase/archaeosortase family protein [Candidatus Bathyarchaeota archaeon]
MAVSVYNSSVDDMQKTANNRWRSSLFLLHNQHSIALALKASFVAATSIALYAQDLALVFISALGDESAFHILAIPFLFTYLLYRKRRMIRATLQRKEANASFFERNSGSLIGITLCAIAILVYWYGSYTFTPLEFHMATLPVLAAGLTLIFFNAQTLKHLAFPIAFLFF